MRTAAFRHAALALTLAAAPAFGAGPLPDGTPSDPHLPALPRSEAERTRIAAVTAPTDDFSAPENFEKNPGGAATTRALTTAHAFSQSSENMSFAAELDFKLGNALFRKLWVSAPSSTLASDGLGPLFNARSCQRCHLKDGRGHVPDETGAVSFLIRISVPASPADEMSALETYLAALDGDSARVRPHPVYGGQLQDHALPGLPAEGQIEVSYDEFDVTLNGGESATLRRPTYSVRDPGYGPLVATLSPRIAPQMIGLGLLEAIPAEEIIARADPDDADGDGISGRANLVWSDEFDLVMLGRFGHKAGQPSLRQQSAAAFAGDIGISTPFYTAHWGDCTGAQEACRAMPHGGAESQEGLEVDTTGLDLVAHYTRNLAVPARRGAEEADVLAGKALFYGAGCPSCHVPKHVTARLKDRPEQSFQLIWPYSDLLLHDLGPGLADGTQEARANGQEWRTAPLWGIGLTEIVNGHTTYLHDGRARSLLEAVLWHGGEAQGARQMVVEMSPQERQNLISFLESL